MNIIEEIKNRISLMDLVNQLGIKVYGNNFIYSIYKDESNPSLKLNPEKNYFYCFSTGNYGDVIQFYADYYKISKGEAIKDLAERLGIKAGERQRSEVRSQKKNKRKTRKIDVLESEKYFYEERAGIYMEIMDKNSAEHKAFNDLLNKRSEIQHLIYESLEKYCYGLDVESLDYLLSNKRGLTPETIKRFRLFSMKEINKTVEYLKDCFNREELLISGLFNAEGNFIFRNHKLIIPYIENNKIVYLRGRVSQRRENKTQSKYIGLYNYASNLTSKRFFNKDALNKLMIKDTLLICEGEFDTMVMSQCGYNCVGIPGVTNFPQKEIGLIKNLNIYLAFDSDDAGIKAMTEKAKLFDKPIKGIKLKHYKDITEYVNGISRRKYSK